MKKYISLLVIILILLGAAGCSKTGTEASNEQIRAVKVQRVETSEKPVKLNYIGTLDAKETIGYSFKTAGQISHVYVEKGERVKRGDRLAELKQGDLDFQAETARLTMIKAEDSASYLRANLERTQALYQEGAVSTDQYEQLKLQANIAENSFMAAKANYEYQTSLQQDATIRAEQDGIVAAIVSDENERVSPYVPVIQVRSIEEVIKIGIPQQDLEHSKVGSPAEIDIDSKKAAGRITSLAEAPDAATRTYEAQVAVKGGDFKIGSIARVAIDIGGDEGIWIPLAAVLSDGGEDYVYTIKDKHAIKRTLEIINQAENKVKVANIKPGEYVAVSGMKNLDDGARIKLVK